ncbi:MAG TPA: hypothetical protein PKZ08_16455 [Vicinamibacterales bacterium]|nr:hypothetical protein [Vicinamibacterales bacterium]
MALVRSTTTFHAPDNVTVPVGAILEDTDPIVVRFGQFFQPVAEWADVSTRAMESVTARPGEKRGKSK